MGHQMMFGFIAGAAGAGVVGTAATAIANPSTWQVHHALECVVDDASVGGSALKVDTNNTGQMENVGTSNLELLCPYVQSSFFPLNTNLTVGFSGWDNGTSLSAVAVQLCRTSNAGVGGNCTTIASGPGGPSVYRLSFLLSSVWPTGASNDSYFARVTLGPGSNIWEYDASQ